MIRGSEAAVFFQLVTCLCPIVIDLRVEGPFYLFDIILYSIYVSGWIELGLGDLLFGTH